MKTTLLVDASTARGRQTRLLMRAELERLKKIKQRKQRKPDDWLTSETCWTMAELTPPLQNDTERATGNSTNAMLKRLLNG